LSKKIEQYLQKVKVLFSFFKLFVVYQTNLNI